MGADSGKAPAFRPAVGVRRQVRAAQQEAGQGRVHTHLPARQSGQEGDDQLRALQGEEQLMFFFPPLRGPTRGPGGPGPSPSP